ncbi:MAG: hypothetical protein EHM61_21900 [Acidobacteria bacterium]|nr:MAG: hypothetical protein EHM61_21900 [Acidobacteriota bacterium]
MRSKWLFVLILGVIAAGLVRGSLTNYEAKRKAIIAACAAERAKLSPTARNNVKADYPTPEITLIKSACVTPGGTGQLLVKGKFVQGTKFLLQSDTIEIVNETATTTEYRATVKVPSGIGPEEASIECYSPVSGIYAQGQKPAVIVTGKFEWDLKAANGWIIKARPLEDTRCTAAAQGDLNYSIEFFRGTETAPFQKRSAQLRYSPWSNPPFRFSIDAEEASLDGQAQMTELAKKLYNPNLSDAERDKLMAQLQTLQEKMVAQMSDMNAMQRKAKEAEQRKKEFGCRGIELQILPGSAVQGEMSCGELVGHDIKLTGTMKLVPTS